MKVGTVVLGVHVAVLCAFALTQGCVTTETQGSGRGAGARHKGPWKHEHPGKDADSAVVVAGDPMGMMDGDMDDGMLYEPIDIDSTDTAFTPEPSTGASAAGTEVYIVQKGDILSRIAVKFDTTTANLIALNNLSNPDVLYVGQELNVPAGQGAGSSATVMKSSGSIKKGGTYVIQKGDTLSEIAQAANVSINDLRALNGIDKDVIYAGDTLDIPSYGTVPSTSRSSYSSSSSVKSSSSATSSKPVTEPEPAPPVLEPETEPQVDTMDVEPMELDLVQDHVVYPGESLDEIARQYGVSKSEIMRLNNISDETQISAGQRLRIPIAE